MIFGNEDPVPHTAATTDAGNVSHVIPVLHPFYALDTTAFNHTAEFKEVTATKDSFARTLVVARAMALTVLELMRSTETLNDVQEDFRSSESREMATEVTTEVTTTKSKL